MKRTNNDIYRHIEELTLENEKLRQENKNLRAENRDLRAENARLREQLEVLKTTMEDRINKAVKEAVAKAVAPLQAVIAEKDREILRLKSQLCKDSSNSSKPSGSNGFRKVPNNREKSGKKQGGQHGHKGVRFNIPKNLDELVLAGKAEHIVLSDVSVGESYVSDWTVDLKIVPVFIEHRHKIGMPPKIEYGPQLKATAVYLCVIGLMSFKRLSEFFNEISHSLITVSKDTLAGFNRSAAKGIELDVLINDLLNGKVINVDETPIKTSERPNSEGVVNRREKIYQY